MLQCFRWYIWDLKREKTVIFIRNNGCHSHRAIKTKWTRWRQRKCKSWHAQKKMCFQYDISSNFFFSKIKAVIKMWHMIRSKSCCFLYSYCKWTNGDRYLYCVIYWLLKRVGCLQCILLFREHAIFLTIKRRQKKTVEMYLSCVRMCANLCVISSRWRVCKTIFFLNIKQQQSIVKELHLISFGRIVAVNTF